MSRDRLIVVDACLPKRLASQLGQRNRAAFSAAQLKLDEVKDQDLLRELAKLYNGKRQWVLVTGDDSMPAEHGTVIIETQATIATIHPEHPEGMLEHHWWMDMVHRWAHVIQTQQPEAVRRYTQNGSKAWTPRSRHIRQIAQHGWTPWTAEEAGRARAERGPATDTSDDLDVAPHPRLPGLD